MVSKRNCLSIQFLIFIIIFFRSPEAVDLAKIIKKLGPIQDVCMEDYIINFFSDFNMQN